MSSGWLAIRSGDKAHNSVTWPTTGYEYSVDIVTMSADLTWFVTTPSTYPGFFRYTDPAATGITGWENLYLGFSSGTGVKTGSSVAWSTVNNYASVSVDDYLFLGMRVSNGNMMTAAPFEMSANSTSTWIGCTNFVSVPAPTAPTSAPTAVQAALGIDVTTPATLEGGATSYNIYRDGTTQIATGKAAGATYTDTGGTAGVMYYYTVRGVNATGESSNSPSSASVTMPAPAPVIGWDGTAKKFNFAAVDPSQDTGTPITVSVLVTAKSYDAVYKVYRATSSGGVKTVVATTDTITGGSGDFRIDIPDNLGNANYYFYVTATNISTSLESNYSTEKMIGTGTGFSLNWSTGFHAASDQIGGVIGGIHYAGQGSTWNGDTTENGTKQLGWVKYDPATATRTTFTITDANYKGGGRYACQTANDYLWVFGAQPTPGTATNQVWYWTPSGGAQGVWTQHGTSMPAATKYVTTKNGTMIYAAGQNGTLQKWDVVAGGSWTTLAAPYATPQWLVYLPSTGLLYCYFTNDTMRSYNPSTNTWSSTNLTPPPVGFKYNYSSNPVAHPTYDRFYMVGGYDGAGTDYASDMTGWTLSYDASLDSWTQETDHTWPGFGNTTTRGTRKLLVYWDTYDTFQATGQSYYNSGSIIDDATSWGFKAHTPSSAPDPQNFSGSVTLAGAGQLSLSSQPGATQTLGLVGSGLLGLAIPQQESGSVVLTGDSQLDLVAAVELTPPTNLTATPISPTQIDLSWTAAINATGYDIERNSVVIVNNHPTTSYSDTGLTQGTGYTYRVRSLKVVVG